MFGIVFISKALSGPFKADILVIEQVRQVVYAQYVLFHIIVSVDLYQRQFLPNDELCGQMLYYCNLLH